MKWTFRKFLMFFFGGGGLLVGVINIISCSFLLRSSESVQNMLVCVLRIISYFYFLFLLFIFFAGEVVKSFFGSSVDRSNLISLRMIFLFRLRMVTFIETFLLQQNLLSLMAIVEGNGIDAPSSRLCFSLP